MKENMNKKNSGFGNYVSLYKKIKDEKIENAKTIKIAVLASFTIKGMHEVLFVKCRELGIDPEIYIADYGRYMHEIIDKKSRLYKFNPDLIIVFMDIKTIIGEKYLEPYGMSDEEREKLIHKKLDETVSLIEKIKENSSAKIIVHNFEAPLYSPMGIMENKQKFGFIESIKTLNRDMENSFKNDSQIFIFDYDNFCAKIGKQNIIDYKMYYLGDVKLDFQHMPELCEEYLSYIKPLAGRNRKCIVLDLDNTLWGGIIGEDGIEGIKLGPTGEGKSFLEFQKYLLSLFKRGVILAINSKNNWEDALKVFKEHPYMVLKEEHFASMQINWNDKISNMEAIAKEINIGLDSLVFIDDDKLNREMIKDVFPEVLVVDLPEDPSLYLKTIMKMNDFNTLQITDEDKKKGKMYAEQRKRQDLQKSTTDITEYLKGLKMIITIEKGNDFNIPRISQLTQKTNQFNMTTKRYSEEDIKKFVNSDKYLVVSVKAEDKFGDNGIVGVAIAEKRAEEWRIDSFLLSCRVIGRRIEETLIAYIMENARKENIRKITADFIPTKKNAPAKEFYKNNGFKLAGNEKENEIWEYDLGKDYKYPEFIEVIKR